jgi:translation initiation factor 2 alpha subunit (eIF-2alpha)
MLRKSVKEIFLLKMRFSIDLSEAYISNIQFTFCFVEAGRFRFKLDSESKKEARRLLKQMQAEQEQQNQSKFDGTFN